MYLEKLIAKWKAEGIYHPPDRERDKPKRCPVCISGELIERNGKYGAFLGCSNYPRCKNTAKVPRN